MFLSASPRALLALTMLAYAAPAEARSVLPGPVIGIVEEVVDGDTLAVRVTVWIEQDLRVLVRLRGIDAPEVRSKCADERRLAHAATERLTALVAGGAVVLSAIEGDKYFGRVIAQVATAEGGDVGAALVAEGLARPYDGGRRQPWCGSAPS